MQTACDTSSKRSPFRKKGYALPQKADSRFAVISKRNSRLGRQQKNHGPITQFHLFFQKEKVGYQKKHLVTGEKSGRVQAFYQNDKRIEMQKFCIRERKLGAVGSKQIPFLRKGLCKPQKEVCNMKKKISSGTPKNLY